LSEGSISDKWDNTAPEDEEGVGIAGPKVANLAQHLRDLRPRIYREFAGAVTVHEIFHDRISHEQYIVSIPPMLSSPQFKKRPG
jgi:hypothetical protein